MVFVPAGEFLMGSDTNDEDEKPQRRVYVDEYWIYQFPVIVEQYMRFCRETRRALPPRPDWGWRADHPVVNVTWHDATAYCAWAGATLPTEAEWEKAARGTDDREYPWGNKWDSERCQCGAKSTSPMTAHPSGISPFGVWDVSGNVWEWCSDWYAKDADRTASARNPVGPNTGEYRVLRGGGWINISEDGFRCAYRGRLEPENRGDSYGFRCVRRPGRP